MALTGIKVMNIKNITLILLFICGGALFLVLQQYSKDYSSVEQPRAPVIDKFAARSPAPDFILTDLDKNEFQLLSARGNIVAMIFWTTW